MGGGPRWHLPASLQEATLGAILGVASSFISRVRWGLPSCHFGNLSKGQ